MAAKKLNVALIGTKFMGKAHSHAWSSAAKFFDLPAEPVLKVAVGRDKTSLDEFASRWGWQETATDWKSVIARPDIDIVIKAGRRIDQCARMNRCHDVRRLRAVRTPSAGAARHHAGYTSARPPPPPRHRPSPRRGISRSTWQSEGSRLPGAIGHRAPPAA